VSEVIVACPFDKLKLPDQQWFEPSAFLHLGGSRCLLPFSQNA
jgi:hypothetical protein